MMGGRLRHAHGKERSDWLARAVWRRRTGILLTTAAFAGVAFGLSAVLHPAATKTRLVILERAAAPTAPVAGSIGEMASAAGGALAAGFQASADLMAGRDRDAALSERLGDIAEADPSWPGSWLSDERIQALALAAREATGPSPAAAGTGGPRILADLDLPAEPGWPLAWPIAALAGLAGFLASALGAVALEARLRRRRPARNRWEAPGEGRKIVAPPLEPSPSDLLQVEERRRASETAALERAFEPSLAETPRSQELTVPMPTPAPGEAPAIPSVDPRFPIEPGGEYVSLYRQALAPISGVALRAEADIPEPTVSAAPAIARPFRSDRPADAYDLAEAALATGLRTLLVVEGGEGVRSCGSVDLVRALAGLGVSSVLLDLGFDRVIAKDLGIEEQAPGLSDLLIGAAKLATIVRRDVASNADAVVWGSDKTADPIRGERLGRLFGSLRGAYECVVIAGGSTSLKSLAGLLDETGVVVVSVSDAYVQGAEARIAELAACGNPRCLLMTPYSRSYHLAAEAA